VADPGFTFMGWSGALDGNNLTNSVIMNGNRSLQALFGTTVGITTAGGGTVSVYPAFPLHPYGSTVEITALPNQQKYFGVWGNAASGSENPLSFTILAATQTVSALFASLPAQRVALTVLSDGGGYVTVNPSANRYVTGNTNLLTAIPNSDQQFLNWSGDATGTANPLTLIMNSSKVVTAHFSRVPTLAIAPASDGSMDLWVSGVSGDIYDIQSSTNLSDWTPFVTLTNFFDMVQFADPAARIIPYRMYRAVVP